MATAIRAPRQDEIKLETNRPQTFALKFATGKEVGQWGNVMFTAVDERRLFLNTEDANEFEHALVDLNYQPAEFIRVTRTKHGSARGGGFSIRVERVEDTAGAAPSCEVPAPSREEALLAKSVEMARQNGAQAFHAAQPAAADPDLPVITPASAAMTAAMRAAVDAIIETQAYAQRRGLGVTFSEESVRAIGLSIYIGGQRQQAVR
jgi:hypothetical protein